jgi:bifunctional DNA-binding transcriptional regulator/antitoxin component of YhaV-PrlF toxin-antitoxin module
MTSKILKSTPRGQITLPKQWREHFSTDHYLVQAHPDKLVITPLHVEKMEKEEILFDADRDNEGESIGPDEMIKLLKKIRHG